MYQREIGQEDLSSTAVKVLLAVMSLTERDGRATVRAVSEMVGVNLSTTHRHLLTLKKKGFLTWESGLAGTLRPTLRRVA